MVRSVRVAAAAGSDQIDDLGGPAPGFGQVKPVAFPEVDELFGAGDGVLCLCGDCRQEELDPLLQLPRSRTA